ncbi:nucleoside triphosphate pyrophosphohydrolase [Viridibacillus sp. YIM B01967]|uniref:Nucleoside triphosphate pyrophosphohydrolase n=1 Tax=Viridibacillus soli TaxID=2798301 RepID=A0ABS1HBU5_9BACL|nr:nucleoside triphosphate pyrophosphohydrolase [Viridibacillus soli]MBK3496910.1 nucleoside triphosphate pyrophosphohydrolase [Viridibacillus soli]
MHQLTVIGLGAGDFEQLQMGVYRKLQQAKKIYVRTMDHPVLHELVAEGIQLESFDNIYEKHDDFRPVYEEIVATLLDYVEQEDIMYAVPGHPLVAELTIQLLIEAEKEGKVNLKIEGGQSFLDPIFGALRIDPIDGFQLVDGTTFSAHEVNMHHHLLIAQVYDTFSASEVKLTLMEKYREDYPVTIVTAAGSVGEKLRTVPLYELDRAAEIDNLTTVYVPPVANRDEALREWSTFREIISTLRGPNGCPWDQKQTHESLKRYILEEVHEFLQTIDEQDDEHMIEELGDVLLQVFLHAQIGEDEGFFNLEDILEAVSAKMIRRHPHVFGDITVENVEEVNANWEKIKNEEQAIDDTTKPLLNGEYRAASSLQTSYNYQRRAAKVGFDWPTTDGVWGKFVEEWQEFRVEVTNGTNETRLDEFGDVLFTLVNIARVYKISAEDAMLHANRKFARRFAYVEEQVMAGNKDFKAYTFEELDAFWNEAKNQEGE